MTGAELWSRLAADGLVEGDRPAPDRPESPWFVRVMLGVAGWIGAIFLLLFVGTAFSFVFQDFGTALAVGAAFCAAAFALFRLFEDNDFAEQFGIAISLAGQILLIVGLGHYLADAPFYLAIAATQVALALAVPNFLHRLLAAAGASLAFALALDALSLPFLVVPLLCAGLVLVWLDPARWAAGGRLWRPVGYGLVLALLIVETLRLFGGEPLFGAGREASAWLDRHGPLIGRGLTAAVLVVAAIALTRREGFAAAGRTALSAAGAALLFGLLSLPAPGLASAVLILLVGFAAGNRLLVALGILGLLGFVSHFYYSLHITLLEKSGILAVTGLCLVAAHMVLRRGVADGEGAGHA